ncbi:putative tfp pilus assembly protein FimV [Collimonas fungivorans]|uniref:Putative tfp pilus assembly protein FimV n=2 Tax=Collimonas fungivorans TaxID=158899 RepID=A0A127PI38_9BURK|nr:putative tfp pilus assembly protein FimV [Collimonas fungivorans]
MSRSSIPGADAMQDSLEFIKKMWGGMGVPGMVVPTLSVEEINKKISDLKAVESWLNLNLNMLRTTIQALEVQSGTISALQAMAAVNQASAERQDGSAAESNASAWASAAGFPFSFMNPAQDSATPAAQAAPPAAEAEKPPAASGAAEPSLGNSNAWWDLLQNQFKQAVNSVAAAEKMVMPANTAAKVKPAAKPGGKASGAPSKPAGKKNGAAAGGKAAPRTSKARIVSK